MWACCFGLDVFFLLHGNKSSSTCFLHHLRHFSLTRNYWEGNKLLACENPLVQLVSITLFPRWAAGRSTFSLAGVFLLKRILLNSQQQVKSPVAHRRFEAEGSSASVHACELRHRQMSGVDLWVAAQTPSSSSFHHEQVSVLCPWAAAWSHEILSETRWNASQSLQLRHVDNNRKSHLIQMNDYTSVHYVTITEPWICFDLFNLFLTHEDSPEENAVKPFQFQTRIWFKSREIQSNCTNWLFSSRSMSHLLGNQWKCNVKEMFVWIHIKMDRLLFYLRFHQFTNRHSKIPFGLVGFNYRLKVQHTLSLTHWLIQIIMIIIYCKENAENITSLVEGVMQPSRMKWLLWEKPYFGESGFLHYFLSLFLGCKSFWGPVVQDRFPSHLQVNSTKTPETLWLKALQPLPVWILKKIDSGHIFISSRGNRGEGGGSIWHFITASARRGVSSKKLSIL